MISWKPLPEGEQKTIVTGYTVQIAGPGSNCEVSVSDRNAASVTVSDLKPHTSYTFSVSATTKTGNGPIATITSTIPKEGEPAKQQDMIISRLKSIACFPETGNRGIPNLHLQRE